MPGDLERDSTLHHLKPAGSLSIYGAPSIYGTWPPIVWATPPLPLFSGSCASFLPALAQWLPWEQPGCRDWTTPLWPQLIGQEGNTSPRLGQSESRPLESREWDPVSDGALGSRPAKFRRCWRPGFQPSGPRSPERHFCSEEV